jgi:hypothetical protein
MRSTLRIAVLSSFVLTSILGLSLSGCCSTRQGKPGAVRCDVIALDPRNCPDERYAYKCKCTSDGGVTYEERCCDKDGNPQGKPKGGHGRCPRCGRCHRCGR